MVHNATNTIKTLNNMSEKTVYQTVVENLCIEARVSLTNFQDDTIATPEVINHLTHDEQLKEARKAVALKLQKLSIDILERI